MNAAHYRRDRRRYEEELLRARRREQEIAQQLQRSMLTGELPSTSELQVAAISLNPDPDSLLSLSTLC